MKVILLIILLILIYKVGKNAGEIETLEKIKKYIKQSRNWNEFMEKLSVDLNKYDIEE